jgi:peroxiredoxin/uncharacterized protein YjdB
MMQVKGACFDIWIGDGGGFEMIHKNILKPLITFLLCLILIFTECLWDSYYSKAETKPYLEITSKILEVGGESAKISIQGLDWNYSWVTEFSSGNIKVAAIDSDGNVTAVSTGTAVMHAKVTQQGKTYQLDIKITVRPPYISIISDTYTVFENHSITLKGKTNDLKNVKLIWSSSDTRIGTINSKGVFTAKKSGKTTITLTDKTSRKTTKCVIEVKKPYVEITDPISELFVGDSYTFPGKAVGFQTSYLEWSSSNTSVGTIDKKSGVFQALSTGTTTIILKETVSGSKTSCIVNVKTFGDLSEYLIFDNSKGYVTKTMENNLRYTFSSAYKGICDFYNNGNLKEATLIIDPDYDGVAYTIGQTVTIGADWLKQYPEDYDCFTHELVHVAQGYPNYEPAWLIEGITDYGRYKFGINNEKAGWSLPSYSKGQYYTDSYRVTAAFLVWVEENYADNLVTELNEAFRTDTYTEDLWYEFTGYTLGGLWKMYKKTESGTEDISIGAIAPDFTVTLSTDEKISLSDYIGKVVLLDFWGTWCEPCLEELPTYQKLVEKYGDDLVIIAISSDSPKTVENLKNKEGYTFMTGIDRTDTVAALYNVKLWPTTFLINKQGRLEYSSIFDLNKEYSNMVVIIDEMLQ